MEQGKIQRINELAAKSREPQGLTEEERAEQAALRQEYLAAVRANLRAQLENTVVVEPDGRRRPLHGEEKGQK